MQQDRITITDELIQRYCDGELESDVVSRLEAALKTDAVNSNTLGRYRCLKRLLTDFSHSLEPDELTERRNWDLINNALGRASKPMYRRKLPWISVAAAAALAVFILGPFQKSNSSETVVESIDCTYSSFMLLNSDQTGSHTIIWINDQGN